MSANSIQSYEDLDVWRLGMVLAQDVYGSTVGFPAEERYGLTSQIRRAAVSIPANVAEGWGRGKSPAQGNFLRISRGSLYELRTLLTLAEGLGYLSADAARALDAQTGPLGRKLNAYLGAVEKNVVRECVADYEAPDAPIPITNNQ